MAHLRCFCSQLLSTTFFVELYPDGDWWRRLSSSCCGGLRCWTRHELLGATRKSVVPHAKPLHMKEWKHMPLMCWSDWCSFQGPAQPSLMAHLRCFCSQLLSTTFFVELYPDGDWWRRLSSSCCGGLRCWTRHELLGATRKSVVPHAKPLHMKEWKHIYIYIHIECHLTSPPPSPYYISTFLLMSMSMS